MMITRDYFYNKDDIKRFYASLKSVKFYELTEDVRKDIDATVDKYRYYFLNHANSQLCLMCFTAEKMLVSPKMFGCHTDAARLYFYIRMVDPDLKFLEVYEAANTKEQLKDLAYKNFHLYDGCLVKLERYLNRALKLYNEDDLWARESIKR